MLDRPTVAAALLAISVALAPGTRAQSAAVPVQPIAPAVEPGAELAPEGPGLLRVGAALLAVLALLIGAHALVRRTSLAGGGGDLRLEARLPVARGGQVAVVRVEGRRLLVGITPSSVNLIAELGESTDTAGPPGRRFDSLLSGLLRKKGDAA